MGELQKMPMTPKEIIKLLKKNGFEKISQNGIMVIVPYHSRELKCGMEQAILKQANLL